MNKENNFSPVIDAFIKKYVDNLRSDTASLFIGAGMSKAAGFVDWKALLKDIAEGLGLDIILEHDLISVAQYHLNKYGRDRINEKILNEFIDDDLETENHQIIARLPFHTIWTTNYDNLIESSCDKYNKVVDVKSKVSDFFRNIPKRDLILYKMHGDVDDPGEAILTKQDYEEYYQSHEEFVSALSGELITKTFLFVGFSFTDPNLDYVLSRLNHKYKEKKKEHFCLMKECLEEKYDGDNKRFKYDSIKQELFISELKRYGITTLLIKDYHEITSILQEIEKRFKENSVFISGSAEEYGSISKGDARKFIHFLSRELVRNNFRIINGFGSGVGSSVINGALEAIFSNLKKFSEDQLILKPFPQFETEGQKLKELWQEYREKMISQSGIIIFLFGNKLNEEGENENADGVRKEFEISKIQGCIPIPISYTNYMAKEIFQEIESNPKIYYSDESFFEDIKKIKFDKDNIGESVKEIIEILKKLKN